MEFVDVVIRQAHPGPGAPVYRSMEPKWRDAERYKTDEAILWDVLVDDLQGTVHQVYGGVADPTYLIGTDGRVAFYNIWTFAPALHEAIEELVRQGGSGVVHGGVDRVPHMSPALTDGWRGLQRGLPQSYLDLETAAPGSASALWVGYQLKPVTAPLTLRAEPLPPKTRMGLGLGAAALGLVAGYLLTRRRGSHG